MSGREPDIFIVENSTVKKQKSIAAYLTRNNYMQYIASISATLSLFAVGTTWGWSGPILPKFLGPSPPFNVTADELSWLVSLSSLTSVPGPWLGSMFVDTFGRKPVILASTVPFLLSWLLIYFSTNIQMLYTSRIIAGFGVGTILTVVPIYIGEISSCHIRGKLGNLIMLQVKIGMLCAFIVGPYVSMHLNAVIFMAIPICQLITFCWMPESPYFYLLQHKYKKASKSLRILYGENALIDAEIVRISSNLKELEREKSILKRFMSPRNKKSLFISLGLFSIQQLCGITAVVAYATTIFKSINSDLPPSICNIIFGATSIFTLLMIGHFVDRFGRKILLIISCSTCSATMFTVGFYFYLQYLGCDMSVFSIVPTLALMLFPMAYGIGLGSLPFVYMSELFSTTFKAHASCASAVYSSLLAFIISKMFQIVVDNFGLHVNLFFFAISSLLGTVFVVFFVPETKQQTLEEIQENLR